MAFDEMQGGEREPARVPPGQCPLTRWREDFPIRWENDHYVTRRELTKFLTLGSCLLAGANAVLALVGHLRRPARYPAARIAAASEVPPGGSLLFRYPTEADPCILVRDEHGQFHAFSQVCTHLSCAVIYREDEKDLFCPCHHGIFRAADGAPVAGPPTRPLPRIRLERRGDDLLALGVEI
jgi:arsenite oxidase small subunit